MNDAQMTLGHMREWIKREYAGQVALNDSAHQWDHFEEVYRTGVHINEHMGQGHSHFAILAVAYFHDLFAWSRVNHHLLSQEFIRSTDSVLFHHLLEEVVVEDDRWTMEMAREEIAVACGSHRASFTGEFNSTFAEMMNGADRGRPGRVDELLIRSFQYTLHNQPTLPEHMVPAVVCSHVRRKFGVSGYARYPGLYQEVFAHELTRQRQQVDELSLDRVEEIYENWRSRPQHGLTQDDVARSKEGLRKILDLCDGDTTDE